MRYLPWLVLAISLALASTAEARLFWQTYGAIVPSAEGGCNWNWNQDYFVPRYPSSGRYGLYSPCKLSHSNSPASPYCHPLYPGYSGIYGQCHYRRRNHVYGATCGCSPIFACGSHCGIHGGVSPTGCCAAKGSFDSGCSEPVAPLYNVEPAHLDILGSIPVEGSGLLSQTDLMQLGNGGLGGLGDGQLLPPPGVLQQLQELPTLNLPQFTQPLPKP